MSTESMPTIVVAGVPNLAGALSASGLFPAIHDAPTASALRRVVTTSPVRDVPANQLVLICGDALKEDDQAITLADFLRKVTAAGYRVIVVSVTAKGAELQRQNPRAQLLTLPLNLNVLLYAISTFGYAIDPVTDGHVEIPVHPLTAGFNEQPAVPQQMAPVAPAAQTGWMPVTDAPNTTPQNISQPTAPAQPTTPPQQSSVSPFTPAAPIGGGWVPPGRRTLADIARDGQPASGFQQSPAQQPATNHVPQQPAQQPPAPYGTPPTAMPYGTPPATAPYQSAPSQSPYPSAPSHGGFGGMQVPGTESSAPFGGPAARAGVNPLAARGGQPRRGYVMTISTSKGGTGKSSLTLNLAAFLGMRLRSQGKTVCVIDANTQQADSGKYLDVYRPNITTIVNDPSLMTEERILNALVHKPEYNLSVLLGPATPDEANPMAISPRLYIEILELLKRHFDYILIDTAVAEKFHEMFSEFSLPKADFIIVPVTPNVQTLHNADNWLRAAVVAPRHEGGAGIDRNRIGIVLNRAEDGIDCSEDDVRAELPNWHFLGSIPETREWKRANNNNELVAPKNYAELNYAFAEILHAATREPILLENYSTIEQPKHGFLDRLRNRKGRR